ncbi:MAG: phospho-sugar mutase [Dermatophilus congolensis]|nr:phospho-sugar mutase [Dermatophilus congolensis]
MCDAPDVAALVARAEEWIAHDPAEATRTELSAVVEAARRGDEAAAAVLASRFSGPLTFGTAGLRGAVGAGESRMNTAVVARATAGLVRYLHDSLGEAGRPVVVLGCDARHGSTEFVRDAARVVSGAGAEAIVLPERLPTPVLAFAVRHLGADAGVMVTASHNPPADNGYKVYLGGRLANNEACGVQIVPPADADIASRIAQAPPADVIARSSEFVTPAGDDVLRRYLDRASGLRGSNESSPIRIVLTPMHGVGGETAVTALAAAGFTDVHLVPEQADPDPDFPTVAFPNPEEPGALDLALALAKRVSADVVIALDPDADRCSVAIPVADGDPESASESAGGWRQLSGDELGALLGEQAASRAERDGRTGALACSVVSGRLLARIAAAHGLEHATTLTGFKWIARTPDLLFGYEEAIGYCSDPDSVRDKDGISAAVLVATLVDDLRREGRTLHNALDDLARAHGLHATAPLTFRVDDVSIISDAMARLRANPPTHLAGASVTSVVDLAEGHDGLPPTDGVLLLTDADDRVIVRPSGTEPKLKCYLEVVLDCPPHGTPPRAQAEARLAALREDVADSLAI